MMEFATLFQVGTVGFEKQERVALQERKEKIFLQVIAGFSIM